MNFDDLELNYILLSIRNQIDLVERVTNVMGTQDVHLIPLRNIQQKIEEHFGDTPLQYEKID